MSRVVLLLAAVVTVWSTVGHVASASPDVVLAGLPEAGLNGIFRKTSSVCYTRTEGGQIYLCLNSQGYWALQGASNRGTNTGFVISSRTHVTLPQYAGPWLKYDVAAARWVPAPGVTLTVFNGNLPTTTTRATTTRPGARPDAGYGSVVWSVAVMVIGTAVVLIVILSLLHSKEVHIRSYTWRTVSNTITTLLAVVTTAAVWSLISDKVLKNVAAKVRVPIGFVPFVLSFFALTFVGWKLSFSFSRLVVLKRLGGPVSAFLGIFAFLELQRFLVLDVARSRSKDDQRSMCILAVFVAWLTIFVFRVLCDSLRKSDSVLGRPPVQPWSQPVTRKTRIERTCAAMGGAQEGSEVVKPDWSREVAEAEDCVLVDVVSFLLNQFCCFIQTGTLPGLTIVFAGGDQGKINYWYYLSAGFLVATLLLSYVLGASTRTPGRFAANLRDILSMSAGWSLYRVVNWQVRQVMTSREEAILDVVSAFTASAIVVLITLSLDCAADVVGRTRGGPLKYMKVDPDNHRVEQAIHLVIQCFGLLLGLAWDRAFDASIAVIVSGSSLLSKHAMLAKFVMALCLVTVIFVPWRRHILPKAELSYAGHGEEIKQEILMEETAEGALGMQQGA